VGRCDFYFRGCGQSLAKSAQSRTGSSELEPNPTIRQPRPSARASSRIPERLTAGHVDDAVISQGDRNRRLEPRCSASESGVDASTSAAFRHGPVAAVPCPTVAVPDDGSTQRSPPAPWSTTVA
jgi:hypothetical protein